MRSYCFVRYGKLDPHSAYNTIMKIGRYCLNRRSNSTLLLYQNPDRGQLVFE